MIQPNVDSHLLSSNWPLQQETPLPPDHLPKKNIPLQKQLGGKVWVQISLQWSTCFTTFAELSPLWSRSCCQLRGPSHPTPRCIAGDAPGMLAAWRVLESSAWVESIAEGIEGTCAFSVHKAHTFNYEQISSVFFRGIILSQVPSRKLTYPPKMAFWKWFSFSQGGIC